MEKHKPSGLLVVSLWAHDIATTVHFYQDAIGMELLPHHGHRPTFTLGGGVHLVICQGDPGPDRAAPQERWPLVAFKVPDLEAAIKRLDKYGATLPWGVEYGTGTRYVMLRDPAGNLIELAEMGE